MSNDRMSNDEQSNDVRQVAIDQITEEYFKNGASKLRRISDSVLRKIGYVPDYPDEFYSLAGEVFYSITETWDGKRKFESLLYACLLNRFKSLLTKENALKRGGIENTEVSLSTEIGEDLTLEDTIGEEQIIDRISPEMKKYLGTLNTIQKRIYFYLTEGYEPNEIQKKLNISPKIYARELRDARAYEKIKYLNEIESYGTGKSITKKGSAVNMNNNMRGNNERTDQTKTVTILIEEVNRGILRDDNPLQRATDNWSNEMKGNLIVTALNGFGIPEFVICERKVGDNYVNEIIDGLQRFSAFSGYIANTYRISKKVERPLISYRESHKDENGEWIYEEKVFDVRGKKFSDLPRELQMKIESYSIHCDTYLKCTNEDVEYHIRRLNSSRSMNHSQRGLTFVGSTLAVAIKKISKNIFFRDTYKPTDFRNGNIQRLIMEAVMLTNHSDAWLAQPEKIGAYLADNANDSEFDDFADLVDRIDDILTDETRSIFNMRDSFFWFKVFSDFTKLGHSDEKFAEFLESWNSLKEKMIDGVTFDDLSSKSTKDLSVIQKKIDYIEALMYEFLGENREVEVDLQYDDEVAKYVDEFYKVETMIPVSEKNRAKVAIKTAFALKGIDDLSDSNVQEGLENGELTFPDLEDGYAFTQDFIDDWAINIDQNSSVLKEDKIPALIRLYKYTVDSEVEGNRAQNWFVNFVNQEEVSRKLIGNYKKDFETLKKAFDTFVEYENLGVA